MTTTYYPTGAVLISDAGRRYCVLGCIGTHVVMVDLRTRARLVRQVYRIAHWRQDTPIDRRTVDVMRRQLGRRVGVAV